MREEGRAEGEECKGEGGGGKESVEVDDGRECESVSVTYLPSLLSHKNTAKRGQLLLKSNLILI